MPYSHYIWNLYNPDDRIDKNSGYNIHHINEDKLDDRIENLQKMLHGEHTRLHWTGKKHSEKTKKLQSIAKSGENHYCYGKSKPDWVKKKISDGNKGKIVPKHVREKISNSLKGEKNYMYGKRHKEESIIKMSINKKEWWRKRKLQQNSAVVL
mgnify:CR=1 FL=1|jgi:hypothetical protein